MARRSVLTFEQIPAAAVQKDWDTAVKANATAANVVPRNARRFTA